MKKIRINHLMILISKKIFIYFNSQFLNYILCNKYSKLHVQLLNYIQLSVFIFLLYHILCKFSKSLPGNHQQFN